MSAGGLGSFSFTEDNLVLCAEAVVYALLRKYTTAALLILEMQTALLHQDMS